MSAIIFGILFSALFSIFSFLSISAMGKKFLHFASEVQLLEHWENDVVPQGEHGNNMLTGPVINHPALDGSYSSG